MTISLAIIARNNEDTLRPLFDSVKDVFDEIIFVDTGSTDSTKSIAEEYGAKLYDFEWIDDFSAARNFAYSKCTSDWIMWLDTDDTVRNAEKIRETVEAVHDNQGFDGIVMMYEYHGDGKGNVHAGQYRTRITRNKAFKWVAPAHEDLIPERDLNRFLCKDIVVEHHIGDRGNNNLKRNLAILQKKFDAEQETKNIDARTVLYLAHTLFGLGQLGEAAEYYRYYTTISGWEEDLYTAFIRLAQCERGLKQLDESVNSIRAAWSLSPSAPEAYLQLALVYQDMGLYKKSNEVAAEVLKHSNFERITTFSPTEFTIYPLVLQADNYLEMRDYRKALEFYKKVAEHNFELERVLPQIEELEGMMKDIDTVKRFYSQYKALSSVAEVKKLYKSIPQEYRSYPSIIEIRNSFDVKTESTGKDLAIMCSFSYEPWSPKSVAGGIGGSEEAVINIADQLSTMGYNVTVYNTIEKTEVFNGVTYSPWWEANPKDKFDYFIGWRHESIFDVEINATKKYLWLHDISKEADLTIGRLSQIDKILVLSEFHREIYPNIPDEKFYITTNGVDVSLFDQEVERKPFKMVYTSSYDRGLQYLLEMWPEIKKEVPEATLDIYYGWGNFDKRYIDNPERKTWKRVMEKLMNQEGVTEHGRVSHEEIARSMLEASVWAYPATWIETNCITGLKAQIAGAIPVVTNYGALKNTVKFGEKIDIDPRTPEGKKKYIAVLKDVIYNQDKYDRALMQKTMREQYSWEAVAIDWKNNLLN